MEITKTNDIIKITEDNKDKLGIMITPEDDIYWNMYSSTKNIIIDDKEDIYYFINSLYEKIRFFKLKQNENSEIKYENENEEESFTFQSESEEFPLNYLNIAKVNKDIIISARGDEFFKINSKKSKYKGINQDFVRNYLEMNEYYETTNTIARTKKKQ